MTEILKVVGDRIRYFRKLKKLTQEELADKAEIHYTYIGGVERGERNISLETFEKITNALELSPFEIFQINSSHNNLKDIEKHTLLNLHQELLKTRSTNEIVLIHETVQKIINILDSK